MSYYAARLAEFQAMVASGMYGDGITVEGVDYDAVITPVEVEKGMTNSAYQPDRTADFVILASDWTAAKLTNRKTFTSGGKAYEVYTYKEDANEPTVSFRAMLKK